jgi:hypothetical protein
VLPGIMPLWIADALNHNPPIAAMGQIGIAVAQDDQLVDFQLRYLSEF